MEWTELSPNVWMRPYVVNNIRCKSFALKLKNNEYLIYGPGNFKTKEFSEKFNALPKYALIPNSFHYLCLKDWVREVPDLKVFAAKTAIKRVKNKTGFQIEEFANIMNLLPDTMEMQEIPFTRVGEILVIEKNKEDTLWLICDSLFNMPNPKPLMWKVLFRVLRYGPGLTIGRLFSTLAVKKNNSYKDWMIEKLENSKPTVLVPNHGEILKGHLVKDRFQELLRKYY